MTVIRRVTSKEMERRTGIKGALGYTFPDKDEILIHKRLSGDAKKEVLAHEIDHLEAGEEGPFLPILAGIASIASSVAGASAQNKAAGDASRLQQQNLAYQKEKDAPAMEQRQYLGDVLSGRVDPTQAVQSTPGYNFRLNQGQTALDRFLAKRGGPGRLGGAALKAGVRFNQDFASNEYSNFLNRRFKLAGMTGDVAGGYQGAADAAVNQGNTAAGGFAGVNQAIQGVASNYQTYRSANPIQQSPQYGPMASGYRLQ